MKRAFDLLTSSIGLVILWPLFLVLGVLIKLGSPGPVFFRQERVGRYGRIFRIHKFRTMVTESEQKGLQITVGADKRITTEGVMLRKYKLDELPQLIDVFIGDMSIVGPRPEVSKYVAHYPPAIRELVLSVRPGITDPASIQYKDENTILDGAEDPERVYLLEVLPIKLSYYADYVNTRSFLGDLKLIFITLGVVFFRRI